jgi:hypothetical protein
MTTEGLLDILNTASIAPATGETEGLGTLFLFFSHSSSIPSLLLRAKTKAMNTVLRQ